MLKVFQWELIGVSDFPIVKDRRFFGINTNLTLHKNDPLHCGRSKMKSRNNSTRVNGGPWKL